MTSIKPSASEMFSQVEIWSEFLLSQTEPKETSATQFQSRSLTQDAVSLETSKMIRFIKLLFLPDSLKTSAIIKLRVNLEQLFYFLKVSKTICFKLQL